MYSLKNQYSYLLKENLDSEASIIDAISRKGNNGFHSIENFNGKVLIGKLSSSAMSLWNERDGSGGRGEFSVVYDILEGSSGVNSKKSGRFEIIKHIKNQIDAAYQISRKDNEFPHFNFIKYVYDSYVNENPIISINDKKYSYNDVLTCLCDNQDLADKISLEDSLVIFKSIFTRENIDASLEKLNSELQYEESFLDPVQSFKLSSKTMTISSKPHKLIKSIISNLGVGFVDWTNNYLKKFKVVHGTSKSLELDLVFNNTTINNYKAFLNHLTLEVAIKNNNDESEEAKFISSLFSSVTTSGEESKSCDISVNSTLPLTPLGIHLKKMTPSSENIRIEVKEVVGSDIFLPKPIGGDSIYTSALQRPTGIRLGGGSRGSVLSSDLFFCLTVYGISTNLTSISVLKYKPTSDIQNLYNLITTRRGNRSNDEDYLRDLIIMIKKGQISNNYFTDLINIICYDPVGSRKALENHLKSISFDSESKKIIAEHSLELLYSTLNTATSNFSNKINIPEEVLNKFDLSNEDYKVSPKDRYRVVASYLSNAISNSIKADWFCILKGNKAEEYEKTPLTTGQGHFILIHKDLYNDVLNLGSVQMGGTGYAYISDLNLVGVLKSFFGIELKNHLDESKAYRKRKLTILEKKYDFINKLLSEGGKAGHMMHPYENLHMKISDMKEMIRDFQNDFEISEKVDGANLFFTINPDSGELLFSRNKSDMTREETLEKFGPSHPAHILFTEGANSIYNASKSALNRSDVKEIFGQVNEGGKTYINFEIMHPKKPNQIKYDMKYIVFHAIVDFDINGTKISSSPDDPRLLTLISKLNPYFATQDNDFNLGSNFKVKLNTLSDADIDELMVELNRITSSLNLSDDMTIADAVKKEIEELLDQNNLTELLSEEKIEMIYDFITNESSTVTGNLIKKDLDKEIKKSLANLGLTSKTRAYKIVKQITKEFRPLFILLGIKLLDNIPSRYMSSEASAKNVDELRRLLNSALEDYDNLINLENPSDIETRLINTLSLHVANIRSHDIERAVSSPIEGGVFIGKDGNTYKVTGGFAPLNQILGTAMRNLDHMPIFEREFDLQERRG